MDKKDRIKLYLSLVIAAIAIVALVMTTIDHIFSEGEQGTFDTLDIGGAFIAVVGIYKFTSKGGKDDKD